MSERAILHFDGDSFFASVEVALNHKLRGLPVVTGAERGAATSASYEAKKLGITRSMTMKQIKELCPNVVVVNSDYRAYAIYAHRMYRIARRFTPHVEEYSVDECFADITGLDKKYGVSYPEIALMIKAALERSLGITFGVGLAATKTLAKVGSKYRKPAGFTYIPNTERRKYLETLPIGSVWGVGPATVLQFNKLGINTALQLADKPREWFLAQHLHKHHRALWYELNGILVNELSTQEFGDAEEPQASIIKTRTFSPPSTKKDFLYSQLAKNIERACEKARASGVRPRAITVMLKTQSFLYGRVEVDLPVATADPRDILRIVKPYFEKLYRSNTEYRATGITLRSLVYESSFTHDLFGEAGRTNRNLAVLNSIDELNHRYGTQTVYMGASMQAVNYRERNRASKKAAKRKVLISSEFKRKSIDIPFLGAARA